jgi:N-acetyl-beta-hexosaminidase
VNATIESVYPWPRPQQQIARPGHLKVMGTIEPKAGSSAAWVAAACPQVKQLLSARPLRSGRKITLTVTDMDGLPSADRAARREEGYVLTIGPRGIHLAARDAAGAFHGGKLLGQLLDRHGEKLPCQIIRDWPAMPYRGVHMYLPAAGQMDFFWRWLDLLSSLRFNTLFLEVGGGFEYLRQPNINRAWAKFCRQANRYNAAKDTSAKIGRAHV